MCYREMKVIEKRVDSISTSDLPTLLTSLQLTASAEMWLDDPELFTDELIDKMLNTGRYKEEFVEADREHVIDVSPRCVYALINSRD